MQKDTIEAVGIDEGGSLWVKPAVATFPLIYREAVEVHWNAERQRLYGPKPSEWTYVAWFRQIRNAAREQGVELSSDQPQYGRALTPSCTGQSSVATSDSSILPGSLSLVTGVDFTTQSRAPSLSLGEGPRLRPIALLHRGDEAVKLIDN